MTTNAPRTACIAFQGTQRITSGSMGQVATALKSIFDRNPASTFLVFDSKTSEIVELDLRGSLEEVLGKLLPIFPRTEAPESKPQGRGRPKLGVIAREVTLLPRHWEWLNRQPGGASVALRKLVEEARRGSSDKDRARSAVESTYRFISVMAGDLPGFEEASRALFASDLPRFLELMASWPGDIREHAAQLADAAFESKDESL